MPEKGFFASLFDVSFTSFATTRIIKILYVLTMVVIFLYAVGYTIFAFAIDPAFGVFMLLIGAPIFVLLSLMWVRLGFEVVLAIMHIMQNTNVMVGGGVAPGAGAPAPAPAGAGLAGAPSPTALGATPPPMAPARPEAAAPPAQPPAGGPGQPAGWYPDPQGRARVRYWDGQAWTDHTAD
jgi:hypothetical protein